jgi:MerR family redox-sensitive transcriptional activator SoxR
MSIGQVAARAGLRTSALRFYESEGLIPRAPRAGGRRVYAPAILDRLSVIELAREAGFTLAETRRLIGGLGRASAGERWRRLAERKMQELDLRLERVARMKRVLSRLMHCECDRLDDCGRAARAARERA